MLLILRTNPNYEKMRKSFLKALGLMALMAFFPTMESQACTGITLKTKTGATVLSRTIEWGGSLLNSQYVVVPRGYEQQSYTPNGVQGMCFKARYGYVGLSVEQKEFVTEGINECGLSAGLFYFPGYGGYPAYDPAKNDITISDFQLVSWMLSSFATVDEVKQALPTVRVTSIDPRASTVHWRIADKSGRQVVLEIVNGGEIRLYENEIGVLTNSPGFDWQCTNLNNYVNLLPGTAPQNKLGTLTLNSFGAGSAQLGLPGDVTPPSRFVRAAFYQATAPLQETTHAAVLQAFQIMNNFDIPIGIEHSGTEHLPEGLPSATQWTTATDLEALRIYYRTAWNSAIRCIDLKTINFQKVKFQAYPLDQVTEQPVEMIRIK
jgi:choloylglycine hydrolase